MTERTDPARRMHARAVARSVRRVDVLFERMGERIGQALERMGDDELTPGDYARIMAEVDRELAAVYGPQRGANSRLANEVAAGTAMARQNAASAAIRPMEAALRAIDPATLYRIERSLTDE